MTTFFSSLRLRSVWSYNPVPSPPTTYHASGFGPRQNQTLILPDGRSLGFAEFGAEKGIPVFYFHGFPTSRLEAYGLDKLAQQRRVRIVAPDRPGYGLSSVQPGRRIADWPADVQTLAEHLGISRFAVLGVSGGGPYALACADELPRETLSAVGILAGAPPWEEAGTGLMAWHQRLAAWGSTYWPSGMRAISDGFIWIVRKILYSTTITQRIDKWLASKVTDENKDVPIEMRRLRLYASLLDGFAQGSAAMVQEAKLLTDSWGIDLARLDYPNVQIWHGTRDTNAPIEAIRCLARLIPGSELMEYDDTHYTMGNHLAEVLDALIPGEMTLDKVEGGR